MSFPRYPKYKDSGVEWLGDVPEHWEVKRSDSFLTNSRAQLDPKEFQGMEVFHYSIPVVQELGTGQVEDGSEIASSKQVIKKKVVLVSKLNPRKGTICIAEPQQALTLCSTEFVALEPNGCDIRYLSYLVKTHGFRQGLESKVTSATNSHQRANPIDIYRFWNAWPTLPEQTAIAEFLDRETGKIDKLVAEQRRLMELLKEKRQAVISHAVTKGLNPHAPMKPSGIEWLGDVPAGWSVTNIKRVGRIQYGIGEPPKYYDDGTPLIRATNVHAGEIFSEGLVFVDPIEIPEKRIVWLQAGDIIVVRSGAYTGDSAIIPVGYGPCIAGFDMVLKCHSANPEFVQFALLSKYLKDGQIDLQKMRAAQPHLNAEELGSCFFLLPPAKEQDTIVQFLAAELAKFDTLTAEAQRAIDLLQERRTALISAAVTGQIDVRQPPKN